MFILTENEFEDLFILVITCSLFHTFHVLEIHWLKRHFQLLLIVQLKV